MYNEYPTQIDHINGNSLDNSISNLRNVTHTENQRNIKIQRNNTSGICGVRLYAYNRTKKWVSSIRRNGKTVTLGYFLDLNDAIIARKMAEYEIGFHVNHGSYR